MNKKRSVGVTIFGWIIILTIPVMGISLLILYTFVFNKIYKLSFYSALNITLGICLHVILGYGILKLNNLARRVVVGMGWFFIISVPLLIIMIYTIIYKSSGIIFDLSAHWIFLLFLPGWIFWIALTYFFTRPKVEEQFR